MANNMTRHDTYKLTNDGKYIGEFNSFQEAKEEQDKLGFTYQSTIVPIYHGIKSFPKLYKDK